jgi:acetyl esterase/lipase
MKRFFRNAAIALALAAGSVAGLATAAQAAPPTAQDWAKKPAYASVRISPDGRHVAAVTSPDGEKTYISIWDLDNLAAGAKNLGAPPRSWFSSVNFIKNDRLLVTTSQPTIRNNRKFYTGLRQIVDLNGAFVMNTAGEKDQTAPGAQIIDRLPLDPKNILVATNEGIFKLDVYTGAMARTYRGSDKFGGEQVDLNGEVRARQEFNFEGGKVYAAQWIRSANGDWQEHFRWYAKDREPMSIVGFTKDPNIALVATTRGRDKAAIYEYDIAAKKLLEPAFEHKLFDATDAIQSRGGADYGEIIGFTYDGPENGETYWLDPNLKAVEDSAKAALKVTNASLDWTDIASGARAKVSYPDGAGVHLLQWSDDRKRAVVVRSGPKVQAEYFLLVDGKMKLLGRAKPWIDPASLGDMRLVQYPARDGLLIPGYLTTPPVATYGKGPYPTIILPHGGPWARDGLGWDGSGWVQYFASHGYAVLQPQFRGSQGWGQKLWRAGDAEWGQKMQDDKDDGARWLIAQGIAAPDRIAMHGFSYGGYSAMAASVRPNGLYQCAMAGAGVSEIDIIKQGILTNNRFGREFQEPTIAGLDPLNHANEVSIPLLLYHGDYDTVVPIEHSKKFYAALKGAGKNVTYVELPGLSHSAGDTPELMVKVLTTLENYLKKDCGPGGL